MKLINIQGSFHGKLMPPYLINTVRIISKSFTREEEDEKGNKLMITTTECGRSEISLIINPEEPVRPGDRLLYFKKVFEVKETLSNEVARGAFPYIFIPHLQKVAVEFVTFEKLIPHAKQS